ncbi:MAG: hypothetical protein KDK59_04280 [Simkania sp.]|nr:hypothetical protein [Simkania sp.]
MSTSPCTPTLPVNQSGFLPRPDFSRLPSNNSFDQGASALSPQKPQRHVDVWTSFTSKFPLLHPRVAQNILNGVYRAQQNLTLKQTVEILPTEIFPYKIFIDPFGFQVCPCTTNSGGNGTVWTGDYFSTERVTVGAVDLTPTKPETKARKVSAGRSLVPQCQFSPAKKKVESYIGHSTPTKKNHFGPIHHTSKGRGFSYALMDAYSHNFGEIDWKHTPQPIQYLIRMTGLVTQALSVIHAKGDVHGDVKEGNVMVDNKNPDKPDGIKLIDYDTANKSSSQPVFTIGTPEFLNQSSFGTAAETLIHQARRKGLRRPCDDMFAFFHMGIRMTLQLCTALIPQSDQKTHQDIQVLYKPTLISPATGTMFSEQQLTEIGEKYAKHHIYFTHTIFPQKVAILPSKEIYQEVLPKILAQLPIPEASQQLLKNYVFYCIRQKFALDSLREDASTSNLTLQSMQPPHVQVEVEAPNQERPIKKRRIEEEECKNLSPIPSFTTLKNPQELKTQ